MTENTAPIHCPLCGSADLNANSDDGDEHEVWFKVHCDECDASWVEVYKFAFICEFHDGNGKEVE